MEQDTRKHSPQRLTEIIEGNGHGFYYKPVRSSVAKTQDPVEGFRKGIDMADWMYTYVLDKEEMLENEVVA